MLYEYGSFPVHYSLLCWLCSSGPGLQRKYFQAWRVTKQAKDEDEPEADPEKHAEPESKLSASHDSEEKEAS